jgi:hypothetical protein
MKSMKSYEPSIATILHLGQLEFFFDGRDDIGQDEHDKVQVLGLPGPAFVP